MSFQETELAKKIIERCVAAGACKPEFKRLMASETETDFLSVLTDNWLWCFENKVLNFETVCEFSEDSRKEKNVSAYDSGGHICNMGYCILSGSATVRASGSATVRASGSATVRAYGSATVEASGSATVEASDSATVRAYDSATVRAYDSATVRASGSATVRAYDSATVWASGSATVWADGSATVWAYDSATVGASGSATINSYTSNGHIVEQYAICRYLSYSDEVSKVVVGSDFLKLIK
jgi:hypothetical protein